jgi:hypothetical protein
MATMNEKCGGNKMSKVGFIGLGNMGRGMTKNFIAHGHETSIFDLSRDSMMRFEGSAYLCKSPEEVVERSDFIFLSLPNSKVVTVTVDGFLKNSIEGKIIVFKGPQVEPPAMFSWSPGSDAFFINDGEGSGMASTFRLFRIKGSVWLGRRSARRLARLLYRYHLQLHKQSAQRLQLRRGGESDQ